MSQINFNSHRDKLTDQDKEEIFILLSSRLREKNRRLLLARLTYDLSLIPYYGILNRIQKESYGWTYCAGQSYPDEIKTVRDIILKLK